MMGVATLPEITSKLITEGLDPQTPAMTVANAGLPASGPRARSARRHCGPQPRRRNPTAGDHRDRGGGRLQPVPAGVSRDCARTSIRRAADQLNRSVPCPVPVKRVEVLPQPGCAVQQATMSSSSPLARSSWPCRASPRATSQVDVQPARSAPVALRSWPGSVRSKLGTPRTPAGRPGRMADQQWRPAASTTAGRPGSTSGIRPATVRSRSRSIVPRVPGQEEPAAGAVQRVDQRGGDPLRLGR